MNRITVLAVALAILFLGTSLREASALTWSTCGAACPESPEVSISGDTLTVGVADEGEFGSQPTSAHMASAPLPPAPAYRVTFSYDLATWDAYVPLTVGGTGFWDSFSVSISQQPYWDLSLSDPLNDGNDPLALGFLWGGTMFADGILDTNVGSMTVDIPASSTSTNYLNVGLDTRTLPEANHGYPSWGTFTIASVVPLEPELADLALTVDEPSIGAGATTVPLQDIPLEAIPAFRGLVHSTPLGSISMQSSPLGSIPLGSIGLDAIDINGVPLGSIPLNSIPLGSISWEELLDSPGCQALPACASLSNNPTQALTLQDILTLSPLPPEIAALDLADIGLSDTSIGGISLSTALLGTAPLGSIPLGSIPLGSIPLGSIDVWANPLGSIPLGSIDPPGAPADMCAFLAGFPGFTCAELGVTNSSTLEDLFDAVLSTGTSLESSPLGSIFMDSLPLGSIDLSSVPLGSIPLGSIPLNSILLDSLPLGSIPLGSIPLGSIPLGSIPLGSIPLGSIPLGSIGAASTPLGSIPLGSIGVNYCEVAVGPPFSCAALGIDMTDTLADLVAAIIGAGGSVESSPLGSIPLNSIRLGTLPLGSIPLGSIPLGSIPLGSIPLGSIDVVGNPLGSIPLGSIDPAGAPADMCSYLAAFPGYTCPELGVTNSSTLADLFAAIPGSLSASPLGSIFMDSLPLGSIDLVAVPLGSIPLGSIPLGSIRLGDMAISGTSIAAVPLGSIDVPGGLSSFCAYAATFGTSYSCATLGLDDSNTIQDYLDALALASLSVASSPLGSIPLNSIPLDSMGIASLPLGSIPLDSVRISGVPLGSIPLGSITNASSIVNCGLTDCLNGMLGDAADDGAILPGATLADLLSGLGATMEDVELFLSLLYGSGLLGGGFSFGDLTAADILIALLIQSDFAWEELPLDEMGVQRFAGTGEALHYHVLLSNVGNAVASDTLIDVKLPEGFLYIPGSSSVVGSISGVSRLDDPSIDGTTHTWQVELLPDEDIQLDFAALPGLRLGTFTSSAEASHPVGGTLAVSNTAPARVTEQFEDDNDNSAAAPIVEPDELIVSHISDATDQDFYRIAIPPQGARVSFLLSHLSSDEDLVMYRPGSAPISAASTRAARLSSTPVEDRGLAAAAAGDALPPEMLQDIDLLSIPLESISANRSTEDEVVSTTVRSDSGYFTIQITGYLGQFSDLPYVGRVKVEPAPATPACAARTLPFDGEGVAGTLPSTVASDRKSLILVDYERYGDTYGSAALAALQAALNDPDFVEHPNVKGVIVPVEGDPDVAAAYDAWDANPCSPDAANAVVFAITALIEQLTDPNDDGNLEVDPQHVALIGSDEIVPFGRIPDLTTLSNEADYAQDLLLTTPGNNAIFGSLVTENVLSDNPYGDEDPIEWLGRQLFVPDRAVGRLVETPSEIEGAIAKFIEFNGALDPRTLDTGRDPGDPLRSLTTGYDFLSDGATTVDNLLQSILGPGNNQSLISETWTATDLRNAMNPASPAFAPDIISPNAHYDHYRALPADQNALHITKDLFTTADVEAFPPDRLQGRAVMTMGCHSGLSVADVLVSAPSGDQEERLLDWPQEYARQNAVYAGNTGYGYGDTAAVALSERLVALMTERLDGSMSVGQALTFAKQEYFADLGLYGVYDEKVLQEATFYGLPMYSVGGGAATLSVSSALPLEEDPLTGLQTATLDRETGSQFQLVEGESGDYYVVDGEDPQVVHYRPIIPRTEDDITQPGMTAKGALITQLETQDILGFDNAIARPVIDLSENEPPPEFGDDAFPAIQASISSFSGPDGPEQKLVQLVGKYFRTPEGDPVLRLTNEAQYQIYYSDSEDFTPPTFTNVNAVVVGAPSTPTVGFTVGVEDTAPGEVVRVLVLFRDESGLWQSLDLEKTPLTNTWTGGAPITGSQVEYIVQALDNGGNSALTTNKGLYFEGAPPPALSGDLTIAVIGDLGNNGWYTGNVEVEVSSDSGALVEVSVDGSAFAPIGQADADSPGEVILTGDGIHTVLARASDGAEDTVVVAIDATPPVITIAEPGNGETVTLGSSVTTDYSCSDTGSGVLSCTGSPADGSALPTGTAGSQGVTVSAEDVAGNQSQLTHSYDVHYDFSGFLTPVDNLPTVNIVRAGSAVPVKWRLQDASGNYIQDLGTIDAIYSVKVDCMTLNGTPTDVLETVATGQTGLRYDTATEQFIYNWSTLRGWKNTCRKLIVDLDDGTLAVAYFKFH